MKFGFLEFWVGAFAVYRITVLIVRDVGPFGVCKRFRKIEQFSKLLKCPFCVSVWIASIVSLAFWLFGYVQTIPMWFCVALAWSAVTIALDRTFSSDVLND